MRVFCILLLFNISDYRSETYYFSFFACFSWKSIYFGDPLGGTGSFELYSYNHGIKMGSLCLIVFSLSSSFFAGKITTLYKNST